MADRPPKSAHQTPVPLKVVDYIGHTIKEIRLRFELTIAELAGRAGISRGMLSKIENGQTMPGIDTLYRLSSSLGVSMSSLFRTLDSRESGAQHLKAGSAPEVLRPGTKFGYHYHLLANNADSHKIFEPFIIEMSESAERYPFFEHPGVEFIHMLAGSIEFRHGQYTYILKPGDTLTFSSAVPHGPERLLKTPARLLALLIHPD